MKQYVQYGCGLSAPAEWINFDASPSLRIQRMPLFGILLRSQLDVIFPKNVRFGDISKGLPGIAANSCDGLYCSHVLEHLCLADFRKAIKNSHKILKSGGIFRLIVPDLEVLARNYLASLENGDKEASVRFITNTLMGKQIRPKGLKALLKLGLGNAEHLWMWDQHSLTHELEKAGFSKIRVAAFNDSTDPQFQLVESADRFTDSIALEAEKS